MKNIEQHSGQTGIIGIDGVLSPRQVKELNTIQINTAREAMAYLCNRSSEQKFPLIAMATGFGKGKIIHELIRLQIAKNPLSKILVVAGTKLTLVEQSIEALSNYKNRYMESEDSELELEEVDMNDEAAFESLRGYSVGKYGDVAHQIQVATFQTLQYRIRLGKPIGEYDLVIVDEVHNIGTSKRMAILENYHDVVGFSATPYRHSGEMKRPEDYGFEIIQSLTLPEAQQLRMLPPLLGLQIKTTDLIHALPLREGRIDFTKLESDHSCLK